QVEPSDAGPKLAQAARQQALPREIVKGLLVMLVLEGGDFFEKRRRRRRARDGTRVRGEGFINLVKPVWLHRAHDRAQAAAPGHFERELVVQSPGGKDALGLIAR